jgi:Ca2+-binding RTX toxin-like protein
MITRTAARVPGTLVTETPDFGEPVMVDIAGIEPVYGDSIGPVTSTPQAPNSILVGIAGIEPVYGDSIGPVTSTPQAPNSIFGTNGSDDLFGTSADDVIEGLGGRDFLYGLAGNDILDGGFGSDVMAGGKGDDTYHVDEESIDGFGDVIWEWGGEGTDTVVLDSHEAQAGGFRFVLPTAVENLVLAGSEEHGNGNDLDNVIIGNAADNIILGEGGNDTLDGGFGKDFMLGMNGNDNLSGGGDDDYLDGEAGQDTLTGGSGGDRFVWLSTYHTTLAGQTADIVTDFNRADGDLLEFNVIDADVTNSAQINDAFTFVGVVDVTQGGSFTAPGQIGYFTSATDTFILLNTEVDAGIDYQDATIRVAGVHNVDASWFVL